MAALETDRRGIAGGLDGRGRGSIGAASRRYGTGPELDFGAEHGPGPAPGAGPGDRLDIRPIGRREPAGCCRRTGVVAADIPAGDVRLVGGGTDAAPEEAMDRPGVWLGGVAGPIPDKRALGTGPLRFHLVGLARRWMAEETGTGHPWVPDGRRTAREGEHWRRGSGDAGRGGVCHSVAREARHG